MILNWEIIPHDFNPYFNWYKAILPLLSVKVNVSEYGQCWGSFEASTDVQIRFSISARRGLSEHAECFPYHLSISGNVSRSHLYLTSIEEGKRIAEEIAQKFLNQLNQGKHELSKTV